LNAFSLSETGSLQSALERTGQAVDATYMSTTKLLQEMEQGWTEPLHEYAQFASIIKKLLAYRHQKHVQYEMTQDSLDSKKAILEDFERDEAEARRLETALDRGRNANASADRIDEVDEDGEGVGTSGFAAAAARSRARSAPSTPVASTQPARSRRTSYGFLSALSYSLHGIMDVDPEAARRNNISKTRDAMGQVSIKDPISHCYRAKKESNSSKMHCMPRPRI
jgi:hypothetical protein